MIPIEPSLLDSNLEWFFQVLSYYVFVVIDGFTVV